MVEAICAADNLKTTPVQQLQLILLTHDTEFMKPTNTGALVGPSLAGHSEIVVQRLAWSRVAPDPALLQGAAAGQLLLLYPTAEALLLEADVAEPGSGSLNTDPINTACRQLPLLSQCQEIRGFVLLDATWQLAHKMYRQSPYLKTLPTLKLQSNHQSQYLLRRNQRQQGWCTAESVALLLTAIGYPEAAAKVSAAFVQFNQRN